MKQTRKKYTSAFKSEVALAAIKERESLSEISSRYGVHPTMISNWKKDFLDRSSEVFASGNSKNETDFENERTTLYAKIGQLEMERE
ncbi:MAG: transposase, partial [Paludibacter sp.]|nr:transposase [Paludibacter sp.]